MSGYHVQAAIAAVHAEAERAERTRWDRILSLYDDLLALNPSPVVRLNRAVALSRVEGPAAALAALRSARSRTRARQLLPAAVGRWPAARRARRAGARVRLLSNARSTGPAANPSAAFC